MFPYLVLKKMRGDSKLIFNNLSSIPIVMSKRFLKRTEYKTFFNLAHHNQWGKAVEIGVSLLEINPQDQHLRLRLAACYRNLNKQDLGVRIIKEGLKKSLNDKIDKEISIINGYLQSKGYSVSSRDVYISGTSHVRMIEHVCKTPATTKKYISKIAPKMLIKNEIYFYKKIRKKIPILQEFTPEFITEKSIGQMCMLTIEKLDGMQPTVINPDGIIKLHSSISSIKYVDALKLCPKNDLQNYIEQNFIWCIYKIMSIVRIFPSIHKKSTNKMIIKRLYKRNKKLGNSAEIKKLLKQIEHTIIDKKIYKLIRPELHYSFLHSDFEANNILVDKNNNHNLIDWDTYQVGPRGLDLVKFIDRLKLPFKEIEDFYLSNRKFQEDASDINEFIIIYALIVSRFNRLNHNKLNEEIIEFFEPATNRLVSLAAEI